MNDASLRWALAPNPSPMTLDGTRTFVVGWREPIVIDPGPAIPSHLDAILTLLAGATPSAIVLTHAHADHAGGAADLRAATGAPVWLGAEAEGRLPISIDRWARDGDVLDCDAGRVRIVATPGHAPEHLCVHWEGGAAPPAGALFVGDLMMGIGDTTLVAPPDGNLAEYLRSLDRVESLEASLLLPAHGPPIEDPAEAIGRYREHRRQRVAQVREAIARTGTRDPDALVELVYGDALHPALRSAATGSVRAIIQYLAAHGESE